MSPADTLNTLFSPITEGLRNNIEQVRTLSEVAATDSDNAVADFYVVLRRSIEEI